MPYTILQFGDFYSALASVWLTAFIVAKPSLTTEVSSAVSIGGVVAIAMAVHYNATSITAFAAPIVCGLLLIAVCWVRARHLEKISIIEFDVFCSNLKDLYASFTDSS